MDRPRTRTLQPKRRTSQQHENARTLDTTTLTNSAGIRDDDMTKGQTERDQQTIQTPTSKTKATSTTTPPAQRQPSRTTQAEHDSENTAHGTNPKPRNNKTKQP